ncbi:MAG: Na/Pi cotransporter family protein [Alphaproteobacteria bacterium]|nr:Na/Pi cotransporter family protein [Alphaproteobacteria bacterium]
MSGTLILLQLGGYVGLLLWGTHMVTTGVERGFGAELRQWLGRRLAPPGRGARLRAVMIGLAVTAVLQSSTATGLMATSFAARGALDLAPALAVMLGANLGSTLITQILAFDITAVAPLLVLIGVVLFRSSADGRAKNVGRVGIGLGLMLIALGALGQTLAPVETAPALRTVLVSLTGEPVLAVLIAGALTWACHSSVAVVLLIVSLAASGVVAPSASLALVVGANLGGTLPPLFEAGSGPARRLPLGNLLVRGAGCVVVLPLLTLIAGLLADIESAPARAVVNFHTAFNLALAVLLLPFTDRLAALLVRFIPDPPRPVDPARPVHLEPAALDSASVALANAARETLRMADMFEGMLRGAIEVFRSGDRRRAADISRTERIMDRLGAAIRRYLADLGDEQPLDDDDEGARGQEILSAVINLEHAGDIVANNLLEFAARRARRGGGFTPQELDEIAAMHAELVESLRLGLTVFLRGDAALSEARRLVAQKRLMRRMEAEAADTNVRSLQGAAKGADAVLAAVESGIFLRIVRDLRRVHSHIAALAYPVLERAAESVDRRARPASVAAARLAAETAPAGDSGDRH